MIVLLLIIIAEGLSAAGRVALGRAIGRHERGADRRQGVRAAAARAGRGGASPTFVAATGRKPGLAVVLVGEDPASQVYVRSKGKATLEAGMASFEHRLPPIRRARPS